MFVSFTNGSRVKRVQSACFPIYTIASLVLATERMSSTMLSPSVWMASFMNWAPIASVSLALAMTMHGSVQIALLSALVLFGLLMSFFVSLCVWCFVAWRKTLLPGERAAGLWFARF